MPDDNYNIIKPVEGLQSLTGVNPVGQRRHRQQKQNFGQNDSDETTNQNEEQAEENATNDKDHKHRLDFKA